MSSNDSDEDDTTTVSTQELPKERKKGHWSDAEDAILREYIDKNGEGDWNGVANKSGLNRDRKSCRVRWKNYLRPDLNKGKLTPEEQNSIFHLHAAYGNKWSLIAEHLPGRSSQDIRNFYNCKHKKLEKKEQRGMGMAIEQPQQTINHVYNINNNDSSLHSGITAAPATNLARDSEPNPMLLSSQERTAEIDQDWKTFFDDKLPEDPDNNEWKKLLDNRLLENPDNNECEIFLDNKLVGFKKPPQDKDDKM